MRAFTHVSATRNGSHRSVYSYEDGELIENVSVNTLKSHDRGGKVASKEQLGSDVDLEEERGRTPFEPEKMTIGRKIYLFFEKRRECQEEQSSTPHTTHNDPSLALSWQFFETYTLPRYITLPDAPNEKIKARQGAVGGVPGTATQTPGGAPDVISSKLYSPLSTKIVDLNDFGMGISMYFATIAFCIFVLFVSCCVTVPSLLYYSGKEYSGGQSGVSTLLRGSAICTITSWVECDDCNPNEFPKSRKNGDGLYLKNLCEVDAAKATYFDLASIAWLTIMIFLMGWLQKKLEIAFDESEQTASDYTVVVQDPDPDAVDPDEWKGFFEQFADEKGVACISIALNNQRLIKALAEQRRLRHLISLELDDGKEYEKLFGRYDESQPYMVPDPDKPLWKWLLQKYFGFLLELPELHNALKSAQLTIADERLKGFSATRVFCTFETEFSQRQCLTYLSCGYIASVFDRSAKVPSEHRFRMQNILTVKESSEPSAMNWMSMGVGGCKLFWQRTLTFLLSVILIVSGALLVTLLNKRVGFTWSSIAISLFNVILPIILKAISSLEDHEDVGTSQTSLYCKIAIARMINSAVIVFIITPFTATLTAELIDQVYTILFADMVTSPLVRLLDVGGVFGKYILAPRAKTQEGMNSYFMGTPYTIAERYTDITKTVFLAFFYASIYPAAYFFCFASLIINFFVDKYCLLRVWRQKGRVTKSIGKAARFFMVLSLCAHVVMSSYWWSGFPYDNLCASTGSNDDAAASSPYEFCNQDLLRLNKFPAIPAFGDEWMSTQQRTITAILGWFSVAILVIVFIFFVAKALYYGCILKLFTQRYRVSGMDQGIDFSAAVETEAFGFVPQIRMPSSSGFRHPFLACNIDGTEEEAEKICEKLLNWRDENSPFSAWNLAGDLEDTGNQEEGGRDKCFGRVAYWKLPQTIG